MIKSPETGMYIAIMAGGGGTRLWPLSRDRFPKQFTQLFGKRTLLQHTFDRALKIVGHPQKIVVTTRREYAREVQRQLPRIPREHILVEPAKRDTAPSIGMAAAFFAARGAHDASLFMLPSDHHLEQEALFAKAVNAGESLLRAREGSTVLLGSWPTYPETGLGYVELGARRIREGNVFFRSVRRFREKPPLPVAKRYVTSRRFVWNMGVYGWRVRTLLDLFHCHSPAIASKIDVLTTLFQRGARADRIARVYSTMPSISLDFAVTERQDPAAIFVAPGAYGWSDVGHWAAIQELLGGREGLEVKRGVVAQIHGEGNFIYSTAEVALGLAGVKNCIVVSTPDAILVCDKHHVQDVKKLVEELRKRGKRFL